MAVRSGLCAALVAVVAGSSLPAGAQSPEDLACADYKRLAALSLAEVKAAMGRHVGKALQGEQYETSLRVTGFAPCRLYLTNSAGHPALSCTMPLTSKEMALFAVQSAKVCLKGFLEGTEVTETEHNGRQWAIAVKGTYPYGRLHGGPSYDITSLRIQTVPVFSPSVDLLLYYLQD